MCTISPRPINRWWRTRWGGGLKIDYKLTGATRFFFNTTMNKHTEFATVDTARWFTAQTVATLAANGTLTGTGAIIPGYTRKVTEWRNVNNSAVTVGSQTHRNKGDARQYQIGAVHQFQGLRIDYDAFKSTSEFIYFNNATFSITARGIGMRIETEDEPFFPNITQISGPNMTNIASYTENQLATNHRSGTDEYRGFALNAKKEFCARRSRLPQRRASGGANKSAIRSTIASNSSGPGPMVSFDRAMKIWCSSSTRITARRSATANMP